MFMILIQMWTLMKRASVKSEWMKDYRWWMVLMVTFRIIVYSAFVKCGTAGNRNVVNVTKQWLSLKKDNSENGKESQERKNVKLIKKMGKKKLNKTVTLYHTIYI